MNYQVNVFGFPNSKALEDQNVGLLDQRLGKDLYYSEDNNLDNKGNGYYSKDGAISARALLKMTVEGFHRTIAKTARWVIYSLNYSQRGRWFRSRPKDPIFKGAYQLAHPSNCFSYAVAMGPRITSTNIKCAVIEYVPELQTVPDFVEQSSRSKLPSVKLPEHQHPAVSPEYTRLSQKFIMDGLGNPILTNPPPMLGGEESDVPIRRMMNALGSTRNDAGFVLFNAKLNLYKKSVCPARRPLFPTMIADRDELWVTKNPVADKTMDALIENDDYVTAINKVRGALAVIAYLNNPTVDGILSSQLNEVGRELDRANLAWMAQGNGDEHAQRVWRYWVRNHLTTMGLHTHNWVSRWTIAMERNWGSRSGTMAKQVVEAARKLKDADTTINQDDID